MSKLLKSLLALTILGAVLLVAAPPAQARHWAYYGYGYGPRYYRAAPVYVYRPARVMYRAYYPPYYAAPVYPYPYGYPYAAPYVVPSY